MQRSNNKTALVGGLGEKLCSWTERTSEVNHKMHNQFSSTQRDVQLISGRAAKFAFVDAALYVAEHTPPGFRSLRREEITPISTPWPQYFVDLAQLSGVDAVVANRGVFLIAERVTVCHKDELGRPESEVEPGWNRVKLCSIDGKARPHDRDAPQILISPDEQCFIWQPEGCLKSQKRVSFKEVVVLLAEMGERLARFEVAA